MAAVPMTVLVVGQTPPPVGGQAVMIERLLQCSFTGVQLVHIRMAFSASMAEIGRFRLSKLGHLVVVILSMWWKRLSTGAEYLYYPPAGPYRIPLYRDIVLLLATRWMFKGVIFHFHAGGLSEIYPRLGPAGRLLFRLAYNRPDVAIRLAEQTQPDADFLEAQQEFIVPNGIPDEAQGRHTRSRPPEGNRILFVGTLRESKGLLVLLEACSRLQLRDVNFELDVAGEFSSDTFHDRALAMIETLKLESRVHFHGVVRSNEKVRLFQRASVFCFPSYAESETLGLVAIEAMQFGLPVVATRWGAIPAVVEDGENGYLVPVRDPERTADRLAKLLTDEPLRRRMGERGRQLYEERFSLDIFQARMQAVFDAARESLHR